MNQTTVKTPETKTVQIKLRPFANFAAWENMQVVETYQIKRVNTFESFLKRQYPGYKEIRWNYEGSTQGHYVTP